MSMKGSASIEAIDPCTLRPHYRAFLQPGRILLTGHSHQAWPDVARTAMLQAFDDAATHVDDKWEHAFAAADAVRDAVVARIGGRRQEIALGSNTHELVVRFLSALDWKKRRHLVTTSGEFHSMDRQLRRLAEEGIAVTFINADPVHTLAERIAGSLRDDTAAVLVSTVLFGTGAVVPGLPDLCRLALQRGVHVLLDAYHAFNVVPFRVEDFGSVFLVAGGYKYAQWGEGVCFLRVPSEFANLRPVYTGWFAAFEHLSEGRTAGRVPVPYAPGGAWSFAGSTYDPVSHYRARAVAAFFDAHGLTVPRLAANYRRQTERMLAALEGWPVCTPREPEARGGFVAVRVHKASQVVSVLRSRGIFVDARGDIVRLGPAPYLTDDEIDLGVATFREVAESLHH